MEAPKPRIIKHYDDLIPELQEQIKLAYPEGFAQHLISYTNAKGVRVSALIFETDEKRYLVNMTHSQAKAIIAEDDDYVGGTLKEEAREEYQDKYADLDYMSEFIDGDEETESEEQEEFDGRDC